MDSLKSKLSDLLKELEERHISLYKKSNRQTHEGVFNYYRGKSSEAKHAADKLRQILEGKDEH